MVSDLTHRLLDLAWEDYRVNVLRRSRAAPPAAASRPPTSTRSVSSRSPTPTFWPAELTSPASSPSAPTAPCAPSSMSAGSARPPGTGFFDKLTTAELRANAEGIELGRLPAAEFDFTRFRGATPFTLNLELLTAVYWDAGTRLAKNIGEVRELILRELAAGRTIIGEFGQAYWLDKRHGFSPNVTASHTFTPEFFQSANMPVQPIHTIGVAKAYDTKVGTHTFLTQMDDSPSARREAQADRVRHQHRPPAHGRLVRCRGKGRCPPLRRFSGPDDQQARRPHALRRRGTATCSSAPPTRTPPANGTITSRATRPSARPCARSTRGTRAGLRTSPSPHLRRTPASMPNAMSPR
jgi:hypothetical protein